MHACSRDSSTLTIMPALRACSENLPGPRLLPGWCCFSLSVCFGGVSEGLQTQLRDWTGRRDLLLFVSNLATGAKKVVVASDSGGGWCQSFRGIDSYSLANPNVMKLFFVSLSRRLKKIQRQTARLHETLQTLCTSSGCLARRVPVLKVCCTCSVFANSWLLQLDTFLWPGAQALCKVGNVGLGRFEQSACRLLGYARGEKDDPLKWMYMFRMSPDRSSSMVIQARKSLVLPKWTEGCLGLWESKKKKACRRWRERCPGAE